MCIHDVYSEAIHQCLVKERMLVPRTRYDNYNIGHVIIYHRACWDRFVPKGNDADPLTMAMLVYIVNAHSSLHDSIALAIILVT